MSHTGSREVPDEETTNNVLGRGPSSVNVTKTHSLPVSGSSTACAEVMRVARAMASLTAPPTLLELGRSTAADDPHFCV